ncbi:MAG TPA: hypothetical protein ENK18_11410 [Deltaproteobacteria bacterium]|nr:hypothetical protein [Deltaproteobacteria bacterium]
MRAQLLLALVSSGCAWEPPLNSNELAAPPLLSTLSGSVILLSDEEPATTYITVYDADNPGPPAGTGAPVTFATVPRASYSTDSAGIRASSYTITQLPAGDYLLNALMDTDGDFNPFTPALAGATCGDWLGSHLASLEDALPATLSIEAGEAYSDIPIFLGAQVTTERPAFEFVGVPELSLRSVLDGTQAPLFQVTATSVDTAFHPDLPLQFAPRCEPDPTTSCDQLPYCPCDLASLEPCTTAIYVWLVDADTDGLPDPYPAPAQQAAGLLDVWPRVYLEHLGALSTFEHEGQELPERWVSEAYPLAAELGATLLGGGAVSDLVPIGVPVPTRDLSITFAPIFVHYHADGEDGEDANGPFDLVDLTQGAAVEQVPLESWSVTLVSFTGQTWTLPNEIAGLPRDGDFDTVKQGIPLLLDP